MYSSEPYAVNQNYTPSMPTHRPRLKNNSFIGEILRTIIFVVAVTALFDMAIPRSLVDGHSMQPTFQDGERLVVSRLHYLTRDPIRGEVMVFNSMRASEPGIMLIKRVIGLPGELVEIRDTQIYINDQLLEEPYILEACRTSRCSNGRWQLEADEFFVMGDNRNNSQDSRRFGPVTRDHIVGMVVFRYWPLPDVNVITPHDYGFITP